MYLSWPFLDESWWREAKTQLPPVVKAFAERHQVAYVDLSATVQGQEEKLMKDFFHFNDRGAELVARRIAKQVLAQMPFPISSK